ncbi:MAG: hypothetical protein J6S89_11975, partial [Paludibacteraceae bacterium]|nr:hypothetical protein [Paludibacteraceae bacterium]
MINRFFHIILLLTLLAGVSCSQGDRHNILLQNEEVSACIIPEPKAYQQLGKKKYKLKEVKVDAETVFDNPDEYRIVVKQGKATITGNA